MQKIKKDPDSERSRKKKKKTFKFKKGASVTNGTKKSNKSTGPKVKEQVNENDREFEEKIKDEMKDFMKTLNFDQSKSKKKSKGDVASEAKHNVSNGTSTETLDSEKKEIPMKFNFTKNQPNRNHCVVKLHNKWYTDLQNAEKQTDLADTDSSKINMTYWGQKAFQYAEKVFNLECQNHENSMKSKENQKKHSWTQTVLKKGTLTDRLSAYVLQIQESPVHNLQTMEMMLSMVSLKNRRSCLLAIDSLTQLLTSDLLIPERKLRHFQNSPFLAVNQLSSGNKDTQDKFLILWMFEHKLKLFYKRYLEALVEVGKDSIENTKAKVIQTMKTLLLSNPESEQILLENIVNRLGDPSKAVASKAMHYLSGILETFPSMNNVIVREVERILYRPNISTRAQYYGICFLSQLILDKDNSTKLAGNLIVIYFSFFKNAIKKGEIDTKLMSALLTGVHRAYPYSKLETDVLENQLETIHKIVHMVSFNISVQALTLLYQIMDSRNNITDRFYSALYKKALDADFASSSKQVMFLNLLFNSMLKDDMAVRVHSFIKRLLQKVLYLPSHCAAGILYVVSEVFRKRTDVEILNTKSTPAHLDLSRFDYSDGEDDEHFKDADEPSQHATENDQPASPGKMTLVKSEGSEKPGFIFRNKSSKKDEAEYDFSARNPLHAHADKSAYWELGNLVKHFHPSVAHFAKSLSEHKPIQYTGDPLADFTLVNFLEKFVFKNPKSQANTKKSKSVHSKKKVTMAQNSNLISDLMNRPPESVADDEMFIYNFLQAKSERKGDEDDDDASITSNDIDELLGRTKEVDFASGMGDGDNDKEDSDVDWGKQESDDDEPQSDAGSEIDETLDDDDSEVDFKDLSSNDEDEGGDSLDEMDMGSDESGEENDPGPPRKKMKRQRDASNTLDIQNLLADADDFSHLLEENDDEGTSLSYANFDKASKNQLKWEKQRETFMKGNNHWKRKKMSNRGKSKKR